jgi:hypothetical protein
VPAVAGDILPPVNFRRYGAILFPA